MIPMSMRLHVQHGDQRGVRLFIPVFLAWLIAFALLIAALPFVLVAVLATLGRGPGTRLLLFYPAIFTAVVCLSGLRVDIASHRSGRVFISFD